MPIEFDGRRFSVQLGSDVVNDGMFLEMDELTPDGSSTVLYAFYSDVDGRMTFSAFREELPLTAVEWFISEAKRRLPPVSETPE